MKILVACEESQEVCMAFRVKGHEAYSCDIIAPSGGHPEWHIKGDVLPILNGRCEFITMDGIKHRIVGKWDLIIAHPPCTYLSNAATRAFSLRVTPAEKVVARWEKRALATVFFMRFIFADCEKIAVENPVGFMTKAYRKPDQYVEPYYFAASKKSIDYNTKKTGLWLKGLPPLKRTNNYEKPEPKRSYIANNGKTKNVQWCDSINVNRAEIRSKTFPGIARAMAEQWG